MGKIIQSVKINKEGDLLFFKDFRETEKGYFVKYRAMINDIPFQETPLFVIDEGRTFIITGHDGTILYRFPVGYLMNLIEEVNEQATEVGDFQI